MGVQKKAQPRKSATCSNSRTPRLLRSAALQPGLTARLATLSPPPDHPTNPKQRGWVVGRRLRLTTTESTRLTAHRGIEAAGGSPLALGAQQC